MLKLKNITKDYDTASSKVQALKGININFRKSEFVSILGQSGCGKTTLLNIIGGLDHYTTGDLIINGKSTKKFKDRDWDAYRNYSVGFVFQSYNLIQHQSILSNVELALTLSGVSKKERTKRAIEALEQVGLKEQIHKKPNQLSGGQMQRVAIARALVNNPDIILADEPTGALDSKTGVQIMEILKKISKDKLIIMVTHNPELAEKYSSRVIKILDGVITDDSNPYEGMDEKEEKENKKLRTSMSFFTALSLSLNNLMTKKGRTILTAFAGSIGIIGIALILSLSSGVQNYIKKVEEDTLSEYPLTIAKESVDTSAMLTALMDEEKPEEERENDKIYSRNIMTKMISSVSQKVTTNNIQELKKYLEEENNVIKENSNAIQYTYNIPINIYKENTEDGVVKVNPSTIMSEVMGMQTSQASSMMSSYSNMNVWTEMLDNKELINSQYDVLAGHMPNSYDEVVLIVDEENQISDYTLYSLGLRDIDELKDKMNKIKNGEQVEEDENQVFSYDDLLGLEFKLLLNTDYYEKENGMWVDKSDDEEYLKEKIKDAEAIKITGIIKAKSDTNISSTAGIVGYTKELTEYAINKTNEAEIVKEQKENKDINVFTGMNFSASSKDKTIDYTSLSPEQQMYLQSLSSEELALLISAYAENSDSTYESNLENLGVVDLESPTAINIYPKDFDSKEIIKQEIENYNKKCENEGKEEDKITYTDLVGTLMSSVTVIVNIISYVLIAFVAISLVVSSIMIGIITYISVLERIKEIGILRAIGASKKDISRVFRAETFIEGVFSGVLGILVTIILNIPINIIIKAITGVSNLSSLPVGGAVILIVISMILTVIAGSIPAKMAAKKDPVEALRTE